MVTRPHRQYEALAQLMHILANESAAALEHLIRERLIIDGWTSTTLGDGLPHGSSTSTTPERQMQAVIDIDTQIDQIRDDITTIASLTSSALNVCRDAQRHRVPRQATPQDPHTYCRDNQVKRDGTIEWGNTTCLNLPDKAGLCHACYMREWRWRKANMLAPRDVMPAEVA
jgi:hypothetical protein